MKEIIQIQTDNYGWETLCTVTADNNWLSGETSFKADLMLKAMREKYPNDNFRALRTKGGQQ